jgi:IS5 family transposase
MKPKDSPCSEPTQFQLFQTRLDVLLDPNSPHPLLQLGALIDWTRFDKAFDPLSCEDNGAPGLPTRLMVAIEYLKYTFNLSDEAVVQQWIENPYWQAFSGEVFFQTEAPLHPTSLGVWRRRIGAEKLKLVLDATVSVAMQKKFLTKNECEKVVVDGTVQEKNITFPTDAKLLSSAITKLGKFARLNGIKLRQSYARKAKSKNWQASGYAAARQFGRLQQANQDLKNWLGRILRDIDRNKGNKALSHNFTTLIGHAHRLIAQEKNTPKKLYSLHEPEVCCIAKGKARVRYEFGQLAVVVNTNKSNWIVNVEDFSDNPYEGHTLDQSIKGAEKITKVTVKEGDVDRGFRGHDYKGEATIRIARSSNAGLSRSEAFAGKYHSRI